MPQAEDLPFSTAVEALIVEPCVRHQAAAIILAEIVIAAANRSAIFTASFEIAVRGGDYWLHVLFPTLFSIECIIPHITFFTKVKEGEMVGFV